MYMNTMTEVHAAPQMSRNHVKFSASLARSVCMCRDPGHFVETALSHKIQCPLPGSSLIQEFITEGHQDCHLEGQVKHPDQYPDQRASWSHSVSSH